MKSEITQGESSPNNLGWMALQAIADSLEEAIQEQDWQAVQTSLERLQELASASQRQFIQRGRAVSAEQFQQALEGA